MTSEEITQAFEEWYSEEYSFQIRRGAAGRAGLHLRKYEGEYVSDHARNDYKVWCSAMCEAAKRMSK